jgi:hypothetical protein
VSTIEKFFTGAFVLIAIYLFVINGPKTSQVIQSLAAGSSSIFATLQGRGAGGQFLNL